MGSSGPVKILPVAILWMLLVVSRRTMAFSAGSCPNAGVRIIGAGVPSVSTDYDWTSPESIPLGFAKVCQENGWDASSMWRKLNGDRHWLASTTNDAYIYWNSADRHWWIDEPGGLGVFVAASEDTS